jgi:chorismate--pyruvate lyase
VKTETTPTDKCGPTDRGPTDRGPTDRDPRWRDWRALRAPDLPAPTRNWLLDEGSLTARLVDATGGEFRVQRLSQRWCQPLLSERRLLGISDRRWALVREVVLVCHGQPWVYARSVIPAATLGGSLRHLRKLKNESLGALIFQHPSLQRSEFQLALLPAGSHYIHPEYRQNQAAWARRSLFLVCGKPLSVSEVFLQRFQPWPTDRIIPG